MQRVSIGRALVRKPAIYLMDEPLCSLDAKLRADLRVELKRIQAELGATFLYVTHDQIEAMTMATHVGVLDQGRLVQFGTPARDLRKPGQPLCGEPSGPAADQPRCPPALFGGAPARRRDRSACGPNISGRAKGGPRRCVRVEHLGDQTRLHLTLEGHDIITLTDPHAPFEPGDIVPIEPRNPLYFDAAGARIA